jgi:hypothetical protein
MPQGMIKRRGEEFLFLWTVNTPQVAAGCAGLSAAVQRLF